MIIFGSRATHLKSEQLQNASCPNCQTKGSLTASIYGRHAHVFWIPFFPMGKTGVFECQNCHKGFKQKELNDDGKIAYKNFKGNVSTPIWKYSGLALVALLVAAGAFSSKMTKDKVAKLVLKPAMYDKYTFKTEADFYSTFKVVEVFQDSMYVNYNDYETDKITGIDEIDTPDNYDKLVYVLTTAEVQAMYDAGNIEDIDRD